MAQRDIKKIDKTILDNFYKLVHSQANIRLTSASSTFKILNALKKGPQEKFNDNLNYTVDRLVGGLASSRALARRGYGTLLLELLDKFQISTDRLLTLAQQKFGNIGKDATRDSLVGYFLLISIILKSENYKKSKSSEPYVEKMYKWLMQLVHTKSYFNYSVSQLLVNYSQVFYSSMLADVPQHAFGSDSELTVLQLLTIVLCNKEKPIREVASLDGSDLMKMLTPLNSEKLQKRPLHPVFFEVSKFIMEFSPKHFENFCTSILLPTFFRANHNDLAAMGLELIAMLINSTSSPEIIKTLMNNHIVRLLILSIKNKNSMSKHCLEFIKSLKEQFEDDLKSDASSVDSVNRKHQAIIQCLTSPPGSLTFDRDSNSHCLQDLLNQTTRDTLKVYLNRIIATILKSPIKENKSQVLYGCIRQIGFICSRTQFIDERELKLDTAKFLLLNLFFHNPPGTESQSPKNASDNLRLLQLEINDKLAQENVLASLKSAFGSVLQHILSTSTSIQKLELFDDLICYCDSLLKDSDLKYRGSTSDNDATLHELWNHYMVFIKKHKKFLSKHKDSKKLNPITMLFYFYGMQILEHQLDCKAQLEELAQCAQDSLESGSGVSHWADILTDQIIAILSATECSLWIRKLCDSVFGAILPHISQTSADLLCEATKTPLPEHDESDDEESSAGSETRMELEASENGHSESKDVEMDQDQDKSHGDDFEAESDREIKENQGKTKKRALEETDDEEEEYLDDEHMFRLDSVISAMFKIRAKRKKNINAAFRLRCMNLIKKISKRRKELRVTVK